MHATGLQETAPIRKHNSIQQKVAKLSLDWSRRFNFKLTILLSSEAGSTGIIWFPAAPLQMMAISIPISGWWFYFPHEFLQVIPDSQKSAYSLGLHWADGSWSEISAGAGGQQAAKNPHPRAADCSHPGDSSLLTTTDRWHAQQCHWTCPGLSAEQPVLAWYIIYIPGVTISLLPSGHSVQTCAGNGGHAEVVGEND